MEEILKRMIEQLQGLEWGEAQENVDGALAYLDCAVQNLRNTTQCAADGAVLSPIERDWSGEEEDKAWAYLQKPPRK